MQVASNRWNALPPCFPIVGTPPKKVAQTVLSAYYELELSLGIFYSLFRFRKDDEMYRVFIYESD